MRRFLQLLAGVALLVMWSANSEAQIITSVFPNTTSEPLVIGPGLTVPPGQIALVGLNFGEKAYFKAQAGAEKAPEVNFDSLRRSPAPAR